MQLCGQPWRSATSAPTLIWALKNLHDCNDKATSAILFNSSTGDWFWTTVGVWQGCLLSPTLFNIFFEKIMTDALGDHEGTVSIGLGGRTIIDLRFADDIDGLAGEEEELAKFVECLNKAFTVSIVWRSVPRRPSWWQTTTKRSKEMDTSFKLSRTSGTCAQLRVCWGCHARNSLQDSTIANQFGMTGIFLPVPSYELICSLLPCHIHLPVGLWNIEPHSQEEYVPWK